MPLLLFFLLVITRFDYYLLGKRLEGHVASVLIKLTLSLHHVLYLVQLNRVILVSVLAWTWLEQLVLLDVFGSLL